MQAIIFDLDGTLLNCPYDFAAMREAVLDLAGRFGVSREKLAGLGILEAIGIGERLLGGEVSRRFRAAAAAAVLALECAGAEDSLPLAGAKETLAWLKARGLRVGIITRNSEKVVGDLLRRAEFSYDVLLAREAVAQPKPHPEHLRAALDRFGCAPGEAVMVGDHVWDVTCARAAGVTMVGVTTGTSSREALAEAGADAVLEDLSLLPAWLMENFTLPRR